MDRRVAYPFRILSDAAVTVSTWQFSLDNGAWEDAGEYLSGWDSSSNLRVRRSVSVNPELARADLDIPDGEIRLAFSVKVGTGAGRLPRRIIHRERRLVADGSWEQWFELELAGQALSSVLDLSTEILLALSPRTFGELSPTTTGNRLWQQKLRVRLEGEEPRFPIETADLGAHLGDSIAAEAPWYLFWSPHDWNRDFHGAVRLYLNEGTPSFRERVESQDGAVIQCLLADVMSQICERFVLEADSAELMDDPEPGSLGAQAGTWLQKAWPGKSASFLRSVLETRPGAFRAAFLALADVGDGQ